MGSVGTLTVDIATNVARLQKDVNKMRKGFDGIDKSARRAARGVTATEKSLKRVVGMAASVWALRKAWDLAFDAAKFQQQEQAFANLAASHGFNAKKIIENLNEMSAQTIATADLMESAGVALLLGIPADKLVKMMEVARASARITGQSIQAAFNDIAKGMGRQSKLILDNLGIIIKVEEANKKYAEQMGITGRALTDVEKKQAFFNATMVAGEDTIKRVGKLQKTSAEAMQKQIATLKNWAVIVGKVILTIVAAAQSAHDAILLVFATMIRKASESVLILIRQFERLPIIGKAFKGVAESVEEFGFKMSKSQAISDKAHLSHLETAFAIWREVEAIEANTEATKKAAKAKLDLEALEKSLRAVGRAPEVQEVAPPEGIGGAFTEVEAMEANRQALMEHHDKRIQVLINAGATEKRIMEEVNAATLANDKQTEQMKKSVRKKGFQGAAETMQNLFVLTGSKSKALFQLTKAFAIAQALIDAKVAIVGSYKVGARLGGPALGVVFAAAAAAATAAQISQIASQQMGGGGGGGGISSAAPSMTQTREPIIPIKDTARREQNITVIIQTLEGTDVNWDRITQNNIVPALERVSEDRDIALNIRTVEV